MKPINLEPIWVDFGNRDEDGAVRLFFPLQSVSHKEIYLELAEGQIVWVTDGEIEMIGSVTFRDGIWVAIPDDKGLLELDKNSPYHIDRK